jgi:hypothetical protein
MIEALYNGLIVNKNAGITLTGSSVAKETGQFPVIAAQRYKVETLANAVSVVAGGNTGNLNFTVENASLVLLAITIDKQPWSMWQAGQPWSTNLAGGDATTFFPATMTGVTTTYTITNPFIVLPLIRGSGLIRTTLAEAMVVRQISDSICRVDNGHATDTATITVKVLKIWRD